MAKKRPQVALVYDFDGTLSPGNMQEFGFIQATGKTKEEFWDRNRKLAEGKDANGILTYMFLMLEEAKKNNIAHPRILSELRQERGALPWREAMVLVYQRIWCEHRPRHQALHQLLGIEGDDRGHPHRPGIREHLCLLVSL